MLIWVKEKNIFIQNIQVKNINDFVKIDYFNFNIMNNNLVFNKDILGILYDQLEDDVDFLLFIKKNNIKVKEGIKWENLNWSSICETEKLSEEFMNEFSEYLEWNTIVVHQKLSEVFIYRYENELDWTLISEYQKLSEVFMSENCEDLDWFKLGYAQKMSDEFIIKHQEDIDWEALLDSVSIFKRKPFSENVLRECSIYLDETCWESLTDEIWELSEYFIREFFNNFDIDLLSNSLCFNGNVSISFIEENYYRLNMDVVIEHCDDLSIGFLERYYNY